MKEIGSIKLTIVKTNSIAHKIMEMMKKIFWGLECFEGNFKRSGFDGYASFGVRLCRGNVRCSRCDFCLVFFANLQGD